MNNEPLYEIQPIPGKGYGVLAKVPIWPGKKILQESSIMKIAKPAQQLTESDLQTAFAKLSPAEQTSVLSLHEGDNPDSSKLLRIFKANTFGDTEACWLHPIISRINHSCTANASVDREEGGGEEAQVIAERYIEAGEEVCFSYNHELYEITTARQRAVLLRKQYGFTCKCSACEGDSDFKQQSDARRMLIRGLRSRLHGLQTADFTILENIDPWSDAAMQMSEYDFWVKEGPLEENIPAAERAAKNLLLGRLREAEGLPAVQTAQCYLHAAEAMHEQVLSTKDVVILPWAQACRQLMEKAIALVDEARSPFDDDAQMLRATWKVMEVQPRMKVALGFLDGTNETPVFRRDTEVGPLYAIFITSGQKLKAVSKSEYLTLSSDLEELQDQASAAKTRSLDGGWRGTLQRHLEKNGATYKSVGTVITFAAPIVAYWMKR